MTAYDDAAATLEEPVRILHRIGVVPRQSIDRVPPRIDPAVWPALGPLYIVAATLHEHGFIEAPTGLNPVWWKLKTSGLPPRFAGAVRAAYRWAKREYRHGGAIWLDGVGKAFAEQVGEDALAFRDEGDNARCLPVLRWLIAHRNRIWRLVHGEPVLDPQTGREKPWTLDGIDKWPRLADYLFALDQSQDRIADMLRRSLIRDYLEGRLTDEQKRDTIEALQAHEDSGQWPDADRDIREVATELGFDTSAEVVTLHPL